MSFESPMFSFDQRQPPTPTRTPTSPSFTDIFRTPKPESTFYDPRTTWNAADLSAAGSSLLKTPKPGSFGSNPTVPQHGDLDFLANAQHLLATPDFSALPVGSSFGSDGAKETVTQTITQPALTLDTSVGAESSSSIQTPPPTSTSASKRHGKQPQTAQKNETTISPSRRKSVSVLPRSISSAALPTAVEVSPGELGLDFSPSQFGWAPATAPAYPQQKLFWDPAENESMSMDMSFHQPRAGLEAFVSTHPSVSDSQRTITEDDFGFGRDHASMSMITSMDDFDDQINQLSGAVDPSLLFSSTSGSQVMDDSNVAEDASQPYAFQLREAQRDRSRGGIAKMKRRRKPSVDSPAVKAAMEQIRVDAPRPSLQRSMTDTAMSRTVHDAIVPRAVTSHGRSSPIRAVRAALKKRNHPHHRTSVALTIDEHGRARAQLGQAEDMEMDTESESSHAASSDDDMGADMAMSFARQPGPKLGQFGKSSRHSQKSSTASFYSTTSQHDLSNAAPSIAASLVASKVRKAVPDDESEAETVLDSDEDSHAQSELRKTMQDRHQRTTAHHLYSPQGTSSAFFPGSDFTNLSPGTLPDPDLPATFANVGPSHSEIRCVCNSALDDGQMIQCESCQRWLHMTCTGLNPHIRPNSYLCIFCTETVSSIMPPHEPARQTYRSHASGSSSTVRKGHQYR